ncbi:MAG: trypsin-like peptidase domain-containing protein [Mucinivorans sp.]
MNRKSILTTIITAVVAGALSAFAVTSTVEGQAIGIPQNEPNTAQTIFAQAAPTQGVALPDLTKGAQRGVEAVVNIETSQKIVAQSSPEGGIDPFELFFGPGAFGRGQGNMQPQERHGGGSGVVISPDGYIVTNNHVIQGADNIKVTLNSGDSFKAKLVGTDPSTDIALLKIEPHDELPILQFGDSDSLLLGQWVMAIGNPYGLSSTVTAGIVSAKGRALGVIGNSQMGIESFIQTDAAVNPGNSGGALITVDGSLIGINTLIKSPTGSYAGYSFAVPSNIARKVVGDIRQYGLVQRAVLGIAMQEISNEWIEKFGKANNITQREGVFIAQVTPDGAAEAAGIKQGDVLLSINDIKVTTPQMVQESLAGLRPGDKIKISIKRDSSVKHFEVTLRNRSGREELMSRSDVDMINLLGAELRPVSEKLRRELKINGGLQVTEIRVGGVLAKTSVRPGYIITAINGIRITSTDDLNRITDKLTSIDGIYPDGRMVSYQTL